MAENKCPPSSLPPNSTIESIENNPVRFSPLSGNSSDGFINLSQNPEEDVPTSSFKKPMGRPLGSKNRPKPPVIIEEIMNNNMEMIFIEIHAGRDIVGDIINCAQRHQASITVLRAFGLVTDVTLFNPKTHVPTPPIEGPFEMTSLSGTYANVNCGRVPPQFINDPACSCFSIKLAGSGAQVYGGTVGGKVIAASVVSVTATLLKTPEYYQAVPNNNNNNNVVD